ncbi:MAG TPA: hypothetical protein VFW92_04465 [Candidatus Limnocylindrales bacterium]|nr:hypothetical protein [Candidatus Limnocylindrales bacterium]
MSDPQLSGRAASRPRAMAFGLGAAALGAAGWWLTGGLFALAAGLLVVSVALGWLVGTGVAWGAWGERAHAPDRGLRGLAVGLGLLAWLVGSFAVYVFELAFLPQSHLPLLTKMAQLPFLDFTLQQFMPYGPFELILIALFAWRAAR